MVDEGEKPGGGVSLSGEKVPRWRTWPGWVGESAMRTAETVKVDSVEEELMWPSSEGWPPPCGWKSVWSVIMTWELGGRGMPLKAARLASSRVDAEKMDLITADKVVSLALCWKARYVLLVVA